MKQTTHQRLSLQQLKAYEELRYGMFIHYGMSTFLARELPDGRALSTAYAPKSLDVGQWISTAREAGMRYAILTAKHVSGHCLWPSAHTDYHVGTSSDSTDVCEAFVEACKEEGLLPGFYYCSWDNHHLSPGQQPCTSWDTYHPGVHPYTTAEYREFMLLQIEELIERYQPGILWIDIPMILPMDARWAVYQRAAELKPDIYIAMNHSVQDGTQFDPNWCWPCDVMTMERVLPAHTGAGPDGSDRICGYQPVKRILGQDYYIPGEYCDPIGECWFYDQADQPRNDEELLGMYLVATSRQANFLLNVPPDRDGKMPQKWIEALMRLRGNLERLDMLTVADPVCV